MSGKPLDPVQMRNALLIIGATILLVGTLVEPDIPALFTTQLGALRIVLALIAGAVFAIGMRQVAHSALRSPIEPWYARPGGALLITFMCGVFVIGWIGLQEMRRARGKTVSMEDIVHFFACIGFGLILITVFNWVSYDD